MKTFDWQRALRAGQKFLTTLGGMFLFAWLPAQQGWYIGIAVAGIVPVFGILYKMERGRDE